MFNFRFHNSILSFIIDIRFRRKINIIWGTAEQSPSGRGVRSPGAAVCQLRVSFHVDCLHQKYKSKLPLCNYSMGLSYSNDPRQSRLYNLVISAPLSKSAKETRFTPGIIW
jgi:hypothetical protein